MKRINFLIVALLAFATTFAQGPNGSGTYYKNADGAKGKALKTALANIISAHKTISYDGLWDCYKTTDVRPDGKIWDMYSNMTNYVPGGSAQGKSYSKEGDAYNREHSVPQSWFNEQSPMKSDLVHVVPTDGYVNNRRSNYPFGENKGEKYQSNGGFCKLGVSTTPGYSGTVFEPNDEYKGDFARIYFYMVTCYESRVSSWNSDMLAGNSYPALATWALNMFLRWAADDPVSQKEIDRNERVFKLQGNRNPFVDYPGLEQYVWGSAVDVAFNYDNYDSTLPDIPDTPDPDNPDPDTPDPDDNDTPEDPVIGNHRYILVADASGLVVGQNYLLVCGDANMALSDLSDNGKYYTGTAVTISNNEIHAEVGKAGEPHPLILGESQDGFTLYDTVKEGYLSLSGNENALMNSATVNENTYWTITFSGNSANIVSNSYKDRSIQWNSSAPRFACYKSAQKPVSLYINKMAMDIDDIIYDTPNQNLQEGIYDLQGRKVTNCKEDFLKLPHGIYIINGNKYVR